MTLPKTIRPKYSTNSWKNKCSLITHFCIIWNMMSSMIAWSMIFRRIVRDRFIRFLGFVSKLGLLFYPIQRWSWNLVLCLRFLLKQ